MLEQRKLQKLGQSTLMVSLPVDWVHQLNLKKGDTVNLTTDDQGRLIVHPSLNLLPSRSKCIITVDKVEDSLLERLVLGAYIAGHETVELRSKTALTNRQLEITRKALNELIGVGMVEQESKKVVIQSFLDPSKFPVDGLILRLYLIVESMVDAAVKGLAEEKVDLAKQVADMDLEANKVYFLAVRLILQAVEDKALAERVGLAHPRNILGDRLVLKALEEVGDSATMIARSAAGLNDLGYYNKDMSEYILQLREKARKIGSLAMDAVSKRDVIAANSAINEYARLVQTEESMHTEREKHLVSVSAAVASGFRSMTQGILQIGRYYSTAAEAMVNRAAENSTGMTEVVRFSAG